MSETPTVGLRFLRDLTVSPFLSKSLPPGVQEKGKCLGADMPRWPWVLKGPKSAGFYRVNSTNLALPPQTYITAHTIPMLFGY